MKRIILTVTGTVQGVGFRHFILLLAKHHSLTGNVKNTPLGVEIDAQGEESSLTQFQQDIFQLKPRLASISKITSSEAPLLSTSSFTIIP